MWPRVVRCKFTDVSGEAYCLFLQHRKLTTQPARLRSFILLDPEDGGSTFHRIVSELLQELHGITYLKIVGLSLLNAFRRSAPAIRQAGLTNAINPANLIANLECLTAKQGRPIDKRDRFNLLSPSPVCYGYLNKVINTLSRHSLK
jgi:hypothetical protein